MRPATIARLALAGSRVDGLRVALTAAGSALTCLALLGALTVVAIGPDDGPYASALLQQPGLHVGVVIALLGLCVPVLVLLAQCSRIGAPARDRRLAAIRLAGATPRDVVRVVTAESAVGAALGSVVGVGVYFALRPLLDGRVVGSYAVEVNAYTTVDTSGVLLRWPVDVLPPVWAVVAVAVAIPLLVGGATAWSLRRVAFTPFGVSRRVRTQPPRVLPLVLLLAGVGAFFVLAALLTAASVPGGVVLLVVLAGFVSATGGLLLGQGSITHAIGRLLAGRASNPALLLAARRMVADPFAATRATATVTVAVLVAAGAQRLRAVTVAGQGPADLVDPFYDNAYDLVDLVLLVAGAVAALGLLVAAAEGIVSRRRVYAAVVAAGTPRGVIARAVLAELLLPLVPSLLLATVAGTAAAIGLFGWRVPVFSPVGDNGFDTTGERVLPIAWTPIVLVLVLALAVTTAATSAGLLFLRRATDVAELRAAA